MCSSASTAPPHCPLATEGNLQLVFARRKYSLSLGWRVYAHPLWLVFDIVCSTAAIKRGVFVNNTQSHYLSPSYTISFRFCASLMFYWLMALALISVDLIVILEIHPHIFVLSYY